MTWNKDFLEVASIVGTSWIVAFYPSDGINFSEIFMHNTVQPVTENCSRPKCSLLIEVVS